jgi:glutathione S-transferase
MAVAVEGRVAIPSEQGMPDCRAVNPQGLVPALADPGTTVEQLPTTIEYLGETHPDRQRYPARARDAPGPVLATLAARKCLAEGHRRQGHTLQLRPAERAFPSSWLGGPPEGAH